MTDRVRRWRRAFWSAAAVALLALATLAPRFNDSAELVRLRNALLLDTVDSRFDWSPDQAPADYARERRAAPPEFQARVAALQLDRLPDDRARALAIARHLLENRHGRVGDAIQADLERTYTRIRATGTGYCGDYADVFTALALAAGLEVRSWAFSFDGFGGRGHIFNEVWDRGTRRWMMIDVFHNYAMTDASGEPLSALAFREAMRRDPRSPRFVLIEPGARPVFRFEERARDFYVRGLDQWYLWWGNAVYTYDQAPLVRLLAPVSRAAEQLGGIAQDVHPHIRVVPQAGTTALVQDMARLRVQLLVVAAVVAVALAGAAVSLVGWMSARRGRGVGAVA